MNTYVVHKKIRIKADIDSVWDALTDPEKTKEYFFNCRVHSSWKKGGAISFIGKMFWFFKVELRGKILEIQPGKLLKYNLKNKSDKNGSKSVVTDELSFSRGYTTLTVHDDVGQGEGAEKRYDRSVKAWDKVLGKLKEMLEEK